ncbi:MAG: ADP-glyceromanno-heptose 6-epimerase [Acidaminococcaceae bacterium]
MIIVTGGAGFIGSNIVKGLNDRGREDVLIVDNLTNMVKFKNIQGLKALDYMDKQNFIDAIKNGKFDDTNIEVIFHEGACSDTMEYNGKYMMENNFEYTKTLMHFALKKKIQLIYASSASTYGSGKHGFSEKPACEEALNVYAFSKLFFDNYARRYFDNAESQIVGLRYFNVYGPQENHKGKMASMIFQMFNQWKAEGKVKLFEGIDGYGNGEQVRDFIYVKDVVKVNFFFWDHPELKGIYNCGTGHAHTFNTLAKGVLKYFGSGELEYVPFPEVLKGKYQSFTEADSSKLLAAGYDGGFTDIEEAIAEYCELLDKNDGYLINER